MQPSLAVAITSSALAGCSLIFNPNNLPNAVIDAPSDAEIVLDADPKMLVIDGVEPRMIFEGQGDFGSQPAVVVIHGHHIIDNQTIVEITPRAGTVQLTLGPPVIAGNGNWIAVQVAAHVDPSLTQGSSLPLDVKVTEAIPAELGGGTSTSTLSDALSLVGLPELTMASPEVAGGKINTMSLAERYARVDLSGIPTVAFTGDRRAILHSMSSVTAKTLTAIGAPGTSSAGGPGAVGGCSGGGPASMGDCDGGGKAGVPGGVVLGGAGGGGGGGFATDGKPGTGNGAGAAGLRTGDELIVTYEGIGNRTQNRAGGGGGGGQPTVGGPGGGGGAGGGSIEITAGGDVSVDAITVDGGAGGKTATTGGGGGAGGLVMVRAGGTLAITGEVSARGGVHGDGSSNVSLGGLGGDGAPGRVRWDAALGTTPPVPVGTRHRGPAFTLTTPIFRTPYAMISLNGTSNDRFNVYSIHAGMTHAGPQNVSINPDGTATFLETLPQGFTQLCITLEGGQQGTSEADKCVDVAFLP